MQILAGLADCGPAAVGLQPMAIRPDKTNGNPHRRCSSDPGKKLDAIANPARHRAHHYRVADTILFRIRPGEHEDSRFYFY